VIYQVANSSKGFIFKNHFKFIACLGRSIEINIRDSLNEEDNLKVQMADGSFVLANDGHKLQTNFVRVMSSKKKKRKAHVGYEVGLGGDSLIIGWY
jgi:hypothetical protein